MIEGYQLIENLYRSSKTIIFRAIDLNNKNSVIIKQLIVEYANNDSLSAIEKEFEFNNEIADYKYINRSIELYSNGYTKAIIMEDISAIPLSEYIKESPIPLLKVLKISLEIAKGLNTIHESHIIHKDINPSNIIYNPNTEVCKIIDFGLSTRMTRQNMGLVHPDQLEGTLAYISPEQTGRMNRSIDYRTDFYSLGITIYELLTGELPFTNEDPLELVHSHIAKSPLSPHIVKLGIPQTVSEIVMKLLEKNSEDRYQSTTGIITDLEDCIRQLGEKGTIVPFPIAQNDLSDRLQIPEKLYGRKEELEKLIQNFQQVCKGASETLFVHGDTGIGKTALISGLYQPIIEYKAWFTSGKFEQYKSNQPYTAISICLDKLLLQLLTLNNSLLKEWKQQIRLVLGKNGKVIAEIIPMLENIVGEFPDIEMLPPVENQNRFNMVFQDFIKLFITKERPLVVFIDDLQWADYASIRLLETILLDDTLKYFYFIGAYRQKEAQYNNEFLRFIEHLDSHSINKTDLELQPIAGTAVKKIIAQTLSKPESEVDQLSNLVIEKTGGNPFYIKQFLENLYSSNLLYLNSTWEWDIDQIAKASITVNIAEILVSDIKELPQTSLNILQILSCIGGSVTLSELGKYCSKSTDELTENILPAINSGYVNIKQNCAEFAHDKIQEAVYMQIEHDIKQKIHYRIAKALLHEKTNKSVFPLVDQLYKAKNLLSDTEKTELFSNAVIASDKAKHSNAFTEALEYINIAIEQLPEKVPNPFNEENFNVFTEKATLLYLCSDIKQAHSLIDKMLEFQLNSSIQAARLRKIRLNCLTSENKGEMVIKEGIEAARLFNVELPENPTVEIIMSEYEKTNNLLKNLEDSDLINYKTSDNREQDELGNLFFSMLAMVYMNRPLLFPILAFKIIQQGVENGFCTTTGFGFGVYCVFKFNIGEKNEARKYSEIGVKVAQRFNNGINTSFCLFMQMCVLQPFETPIAIEQRLKSGMNFSLEKGDIEYASYNLFYIAPTQIAMGLPLQNVFKELNRNLILLERLKQKATNLYVSIYQQFFENIFESQEPNNILSGNYFNEQTIFLDPDCKNDINLRLHYSFPKLLLNLLFEKYKESVELISFIEQNALTFESQPYAIADKFNICLIYTALYSISDKVEQPKIFERIEHYLAEFKNYLSLDSQIHYNKYCLIHAEWNDITNAEMENTLRFYEEAIISARNYGYLYEEAIALERASLYYRKKGIISIADDYINKAYMCYKRWGCKPKLKLLEKEHENKWSSLSIPSSFTQSGFSSTKSSTSNSNIDVGTIIKATQAISGETDMHQLLKKIISIATENAGAERGILILKKNDENYCIEAEIDVSNSKTEILQSTPLDQFEKIPMQLVQYVINTKKSSIQENASLKGDFIHDSYIVDRKLKSALCMPILHQGKLSGIFYLENNLLANAFRSERTEILKAIAAQAAISIENAQLVEKLKSQNDAILTQNEEYEVLNEELTQTNIELSKAKEKAEEHVNKFKSLVETTSDWIWEIDSEGNFTYVSPRVEDLLGYSPKELIGKNAFDLMSEEEAKRVDKIYSRYLEQNIAFNGMINRNIHKNGSEIIIESSGVPIFDKNGQLVGYRGIDRDITERQKTETELRTAKEKAEESDRLKTEFFHNMSHEVRTPLNGILGFTSFLEDSEISHEQRNKYIKIIKESGDQLLRIIEDILEISQLGTKQVKVKEDIVCLNDLLSQTFAVFELKAIQNNIAISFNKKYSKDASTILSDANKLNRIVNNLLENALKFTQEGSIDFGFEIKDNEVEIYVQDTGIGINDDKIESIFDRFSQEEKELSRKVGGLGLGLSIAKENTILLGGKIRVESKKHKGSVFYVTLPYKPALVSETQHKTTTSSSFQSDRTILIAEDEEINFLYIYTLLKDKMKYSCNILRAHNGNEAVEIFKSDKSVNIILMDLKMPEKSGYEATTEIRKINPNIPIIALTAYSTQSDIHKAKASGCNDFISKPIHLGKLKTILENYSA